MNISDAGLEFIKDHEGCVLAAYPDPATGGHPWTIGVGHTGPEVRPGVSITMTQAMEFLKEDCRAAERCILAHVHVPAELTQNQWDALVSFIFNVGCGAFKGSTMLNRINDGDFDGAAEQFKRWNRAAGKVMAGLTTRRAHEAELFQTA